jgi:hypothetical protein
VLISVQEYIVHDAVLFFVTPRLLAPFCTNGLHGVSTSLVSLPVAARSDWNATETYESENYITWSATEKESIR